MISSQKTISALLCLFALCICSINIAHSNSYRNYTTNHGLPSNQVYSVCQDKNGVMWFATDRGLASFNGIYFKTFGLLDGLEDEVVFGLYPQDNGEIYCGTLSNQIFYFHPDSLIIHSYEYNSILKNISPAQIRGIEVGDFGIRCRFLMRNGFIEISKNGKLKEFGFGYFSVYARVFVKETNGYYYPYEFTGKDSLNLSMTQRKIFAVRGDYLYTAGHYGVNVTKNGKLIRHIRIYNDSIMESSDIGISSEGFWLATKGEGMMMYSETGEYIKTHLDKLATSNYYEMPDGSFWISTLHNGVYYFPKEQIRTLEGTLGKMVNSISTNEKNDILIGLSEFSLLIYKNAVSSPVHHKTIAEGISEYSEATKILFDNRVGSKGKYAKKISDNTNAPSLLCFGHGIANTNSRVVFNTQGTYLTNDAEYLHDNIVFASSSTISLIGKDYTIIKTVETGVPTIDLDIYKNRIFCATKGKGLMVYDRDLNLIGHYTRNDGLMSNYLSEILIENDNRIWLGTRGGLNILVRQEKGWKIEKITTNEGLSHPEIKDLKIIRDTVYIGTRYGLNYFALNELNQILKNEVDIHFYFTDIRVNDKKQNDLKDLSHTENRISINYELATFVNHRELAFRYKLEGLNNNWYFTKDRSITFNSLPPGSYLLTIQPVMDDQPLSESIQQKIIIHPAYYTTWYFITGIIVLVIFVVWLFFKYRILNYNREIIREILRQLLKRIKPKTDSITVRSNGKDIRIKSADIYYVEANGNYINIITFNDKIIVREKISNFLNQVPDPLEYIQIRRSLIVRIDQITAKSVNSVTVNKIELKVGNTYLGELKKIQL